MQVDLYNGRKTVVVVVCNSVFVYTAADNKEITALIGLDLSAAFDTICHSTLTQRLQTEFGVLGTAISWIQSYLHGWTQYVNVRAEWLQSLSSRKTDSRCIKMMITFNDTVIKRSKSMYTSFCES